MPEKTLSVSFASDENILELEYDGGTGCCDFTKKNHTILHSKRVTFWYGNYISIKLSFKKTIVGNHVWKKNSKFTWNMYCRNEMKKRTISGDILGGVLRNANKARARQPYVETVVESCSVGNSWRNY